jgi:hypothetical protein
MKNRLPKGILSMAAVAACVICRAHTNVYSINIPSFAERNGLTSSRTAKRFAHITHQPDEICLMNYSYDNGSVSSCAEWFITTNALAKQPRWDGFSSEPPVSARRACSLALPHVRDQFPEIKSWSVEEVVLRHPNAEKGDPSPNLWYYTITFKPRESETKIQSHTNSCLMQLVLLDGQVLPPRFAKQE